MRAERDYRGRGEVEVAVIDALVERGEEGMTVLELRAAVDADIEAIETALSTLKRDGLIDVTMDGGDTVIRPDERVTPAPNGDPPQPSLLERLRKRLPF